MPSRKARGQEQERSRSRRRAVQAGLGRRKIVRETAWNEGNSAGAPPWPALAGALGAGGIFSGAGDSLVSKKADRWFARRPLGGRDRQTWSALGAKRTQGFSACAALARPRPKAPVSARGRPRQLSLLHDRSPAFADRGGQWPGGDSSLHSEPWPVSSLARLFQIR